MTWSVTSASFSLCLLLVVRCPSVRLSVTHRHATYSRIGQSNQTDALTRHTQRERERIYLPHIITTIEWGWLWNKIWLSRVYLIQHPTTSLASAPLRSMSSLHLQKITHANDKIVAKIVLCVHSKERGSVRGKACLMPVRENSYLLLLAGLYQIM